eukprot:5905543-Amphidinium_carterae.1
MCVSTVSVSSWDGSQPPRVDYGAVSPPAVTQRKLDLMGESVTLLFYVFVLVVRIALRPAGA